MYKIEIKTKELFKNGNAASILEEIKSLGITDIKKVDYSPLYFIDADLTSDEVKKIASELLADPITQDWAIIKEKSKTNIEKNSKGQSYIEVYYKKGVTDAPAESVVKAVKDLGITKEIKVKTGHRYYFWGDISNEVLEMIAKKILSNNIIQGHKIN